MECWHHAPLVAYSWWVFKLLKATPGCYQRIANVEHADQGQGEHRIDIQRDDAGKTSRGASEYRHTVPLIGTVTWRADGANSRYLKTNTNRRIFPRQISAWVGILRYTPPGLKLPSVVDY